MPGLQEGDRAAEVGNLIENIGSILACLGAIFNCSPKKEWKRWGFGIWIFSNGCLLWWAINLQAWYPSGMYLLFVGTATYGFLNHNSTKLESE